jgi:hypothetical protein
MPFKSEKQRKFMHAQHPDIAQKWEQETKAEKKAEKKATKSKSKKK